MAGEQLLELIRTREPTDDIWQEAIQVSELLDTQLPEVLRITLQALAITTDEDTIAALATCLLEHVLERDFSVFPMLEQRIIGGDDTLLYALSMCAKFGATRLPHNAPRVERLISTNRDRLRRVAERFNGNGPEKPIG